jgi:hypothetical protein
MIGGNIEAPSTASLLVSLSVVGTNTVDWRQQCYLNYCMVLVL